MANAVKEKCVYFGMSEILAQLLPMKFYNLGAMKYTLHKQKSEGELIFKSLDDKIFPQ